ncbi:MAG: hypothetical protein IJ097_01610 [Bacilli bacterium]|nr:hypothetical protein [Bacilli bacterium]
MKKNSVFKLMFMLLIVFLCSACNGNVTRSIRHDGFTVGDKFTCDTFFSKKDETPYKKIKYLTNTHIIDEDGKIYEISLNQKYSNKQNCKSVDNNIIVKAIFDDRIIKGNDNKYYYLYNQNDVVLYSEVPTTDNSYDLYNLLLKDENVVKVITANSSTGTYYALNRDGNVYNINISKDSNTLNIKYISIIYDKTKYGSKIIDFNYAGNSLSTFIKTEDKIYRMKITNYEDCSKYVDVSCKYEMMEDSVFEKYKDRIIAYNGNILITDYKQIFTVNQ